jgi:NADH-quinone oxidoreductase subunit I
MKEYFKNTWQALYTAFVGMKITFKHLFIPAVTIQYPDVKLDLPVRSRNRLNVHISDCIGCEQCSRACPVDCISIETVKSVPGDGLTPTSEGRKRVLWLKKFDIDIAKCCFCGLCTYNCPTGCIKMTDVYEFSEYDRNDLIYHFSAMTEAEIEEKQKNLAKADAEKAAQKAAAAAASKAEAPKPVPPAPAVQDGNAAGNSDSK